MSYCHPVSGRNMGTSYAHQPVEGVPASTRNKVQASWVLCLGFNVQEPLSFLAEDRMNGTIHGWDMWVRENPRVYQDRHVCLQCMEDAPRPSSQLIAVVLGTGFFRCDLLPFFTSHPRVQQAAPFAGVGGRRWRRWRGVGGAGPPSETLCMAWVSLSPAPQGLGAALWQVSRTGTLGDTHCPPEKSQ